jgi:superfamily II DNA/RNA helicase
VAIPGFVRLNQPTIINYLKENAASKLALKIVESPAKNKLQTLLDLVVHLGNQQGIIFCNLRDSIEEVSAFLERNKVSHSCFSGGMEQKDRERSLIKFRNGTSRLLLATDLAARGIDIPEMKVIIHYELPKTLDEFTHRNGRTARVNAKGTAYILKWKKENLPEFIKNTQSADISMKAPLKPQYWETLFLSGGRKDKISKGDIAGMFFKQGKINQDQLGSIELKQDCAFVAVPLTIANELVEKLNNTRLKKKKIRITVL